MPQWKLRGSGTWLKNGRESRSSPAARAALALAVAKRLAADGYDVLLTYRGDAEAAEAAKSELAGSDRQVEVIAADVSTADGAGAAIEAAMKQLGRLDVLVNNAGITRDTLLMRMTDADWDDVLTTNLKGAFLTRRKPRCGRCCASAPAASSTSPPSSVRSATPDRRTTRRQRPA